LASYLKITEMSLRWLLGALFVWAGVVKLANPKAFARAIDAYGLLPEVLLPGVALLLPLAEIAVGVAAVRRWRGGLAGMAALLFLFLAVLAYAMGQQLDVDCGCFSLAERHGQTSVRTAFGRDLLMLVGVALAGWLGYRNQRVHQGGSPHPNDNEERA
jgi:hypothetical protein